MIKFLTVGAMLLAFTMSGCEKSEESKSEPAATKTATEKVTEAAKTAAGEVKETAKTVAEETRETTAAAVDKTKEMAGQAAESTKEAAGEAVDAVKQAVSPETIVLEASYGNVTFPHALHQDAFECSTCHGEGTPGLFGLDKDKAHALCRDCHKEQGAGPTGCTDCHKK
jgi:hypothetical protein